MKAFMILSFIFISAAMMAQPSRQEVLKFKIKKVTISSSGGARGEGKDEYYYDEKGNDTAMYSDGILQYRKKYEFDSKGRISRIQYSTTSDISEVTEYKYKPDGSYTTVSTDQQFHLATKQYYDKKDRLTKIIIPDGTQYIYNYDPAGRLKKIFSIPVKGEKRSTAAYTYNSKGQLVSVVNSGNYSSTQKYFYDAKGLLIKEEDTGMFEGQKEVVVRNYSYEFL